MIDKKHDLPIARQAKALKLSRGSVYYLPRPVPAADLAMMRRMDALHREVPFAGSRMLRDLLNAEGFETGRQHVVTLMKRMAIEAIYRKPNTSKPTPGHMIYPYLLRKLQIGRPNQRWAPDITYIPRARGFVYLTAVVDWFSRRVLSWRVSITMEAEFCIEALEEALAKHGAPDIFNTEFTSAESTSVLINCSSLYLILQTASFWRWPVHCRWWSGSDHFFPRNRDGVKECLQRRLAEAPAALMRSLLVVAFDP